MKFDINAFLDSLPLMGYGVGGIFIVMIIVALVTMALKKVFSR